MIRLAYMNETNTTPRQKLILNLISQSGGLGRGEIQKEVVQSHKISKPTLIRDLNNLLKKEMVKIKGKGKNTKYFPFTKNPLLKPFDLDQYFLQEADERLGAKKSFDFGVFNYLKDLFLPTEIERIEKVQRSFNEQTARLESDILKKELERFVIELSWKSSKIEGNTYTLLETEDLIKKDQKAEGKTRAEAVMILNHKSAFEEILKNKNEFKEITLSKVNQLHNILVKDLNIGLGIRKQAVGITGTVYQPLNNEFRIKEAMEKLFETLNENNNPLEKALMIKAMIPYIQPYSDGNKRTARMLANALLLAYDFYPLSYRSINEEEFKKALIVFYEQSSIYHLKRLFIQQVIFAYKSYFK